MESEKKAISTEPCEPSEAHVTRMVCKHHLVISRRHAYSWDCRFHFFCFKASVSLHKHWALCYALRDDAGWIKYTVHSLQEKKKSCRECIYDTRKYVIKTILEVKREIAKSHLIRAYWRLPVGGGVWVWPWSWVGFGHDYTHIVKGNCRGNPTASNRAFYWVISFPHLLNIFDFITNLPILMFILI